MTDAAWILIIDIFTHPKSITSIHKADHVRDVECNLDQCIDSESWLHEDEWK